MKKIIAVALSLVMILGLSVTAFAATSPQGTTYHKVVVVFNAKDKIVTKIAPYTATEGADSITFTAKPANANDVFLGWSIYKKDGTPATAGTDFDLVDTTSATGTALTGATPRLQRGILLFDAEVQTCAAAATTEFAGQTLYTDTSITLVPKTDLIVAGNWNNQLTSIKTALAAFADTSDKTGDAVAAVAVCVAALALAGVAVSKKQLAK